MPWHLTEVALHAHHKTNAQIALQLHATFHEGSDLILLISVGDCHDAPPSPSVNLEDMYGTVMSELQEKIEGRYLQGRTSHETPANEIDHTVTNLLPLPHCVLWQMFQHRHQSFCARSQSCHQLAHRDSRSHDLISAMQNAAQRITFQHTCQQRAPLLCVQTYGKSD